MTAPVSFEYSNARQCCSQRPAYRLQGQAALPHHHHHHNCWLPATIKEHGTNGEGRKKHGDIVDIGTQTMQEASWRSSEHLLSRQFFFLYNPYLSVDLRKMKMSEVTKQTVKISLRTHLLKELRIWVQFLATWPLQSMR